MIDYTGRAVDELRRAAATWPAPLTNYLIRGGELEGADIPTDSKAPSAIIVRRMGPIRRVRIPMADFMFAVIIYHPDMRIVAQIAALVSDAFHDAGPRVKVAGGHKIGAWRSTDIGSSGSLVEPDTNWPREQLTISILAPTVALS